MQGTEGMFQILLSHNPTHWRREVLPRSDISLMLAGHTHAMQGILFGHSLAELIYPEWRGMYYEGKRALYVNNWHRLCRTAVPVRGMAGNYSTKISKRERVTK